MNSDGEYFKRRLIRAASIIDGRGFCASPGVVLVEGSEILEAGSPQEVGEVSEVLVEDCSGAVVIPALVNVHAHLDLTHMGPVEFAGDFSEWVGRVRRERKVLPEEIAASVKLGAELARAGGTGLIGDIAGAMRTEPLHALRESGLAGVSFLEVFGLGAGAERAVAVMKGVREGEVYDEGGVRLGLQPHAPYSCDESVYRAAAEMGLPLSTHLAETREEIEFVEKGTGLLAEMLAGMGVWEMGTAGSGRHPIEHLESALSGQPWVAAHLNYVEDHHLEMLAGWPITVGYCPRASAYFHHDGHRYREMMERGINVALGTDSILCLDTPDRISVWDEMRFLYERDGTDPALLLRMATMNGARALGFEESWFTLERGPVAGLLAFEIEEGAGGDFLSRALGRSEGPRWVVGPFAVTGEGV